MAKGKVIAFKINLNGTDVIVKNITDIQLALKEVSKQMKTAGDDETYNKLAKEQIRLKVALKQATEEQKRQIASFEKTKSAIGSYRALKAELTKLKSIYKDLSKEQKDGNKGKLLLRRIAALNTQIKETDTSLRQLQQTQSKPPKLGSITAIKEEIKKATEAYNELSEAERSGKEGQGRLKHIAKLKGKIKEVTEAQRLATAEMQKTQQAEGSYRQLEARMHALKLAWKKMSAEERNSELGVRTRNQIAELDKELKQLDKTIGQHQRNVGNYTSAITDLLQGDIQSVASSLGLSEKAINGIAIAIAGFAIVGSTIKKATDIFREFDLEIATLGAISGATGEDLKRLEDDAKRLGSTTQFTAKQVAELQIEFAKKGYDTSQIVAATEATLNLATATRTDLAEAAEVASATLGGFGLNAEETQRVTDVMASSFNSSALDIEKYRESMKLVAPIANAANISIEESTAILGALADVGLSGSIAGTAVKNILGGFGNDNSGLSKFLGKTVNSFDELVVAMEDASKRTNNFALANEYLDERQKASVLALVKSTDKLNTLRESFENASEEVEVFSASGESLGTFAGQAAAAAAKIGDTLEGDIKKRESALEGLFLSIGGGMENMSRRFVQAQTTMINSVANFIAAIKSVKEFVQENRIALGVLIVALLSLNTQLVLSTAATLAKAAADKIAAVSAQAAAAKQAILNATMSANPVGGLIAAMTALYLVYKVFTSNTSTATKAQNELNKSLKDTRLEIAKESRTIKDNFDVLKSDTASKEDKTRALKELKAQYPDYFKNIDIETVKLGELNKIQSEILSNIKKTIIERNRTAALDKYISKEIAAEEQILALRREGEKALTKRDKRRGKGGLLNQITGTAPKLENGETRGELSVRLAIKEQERLKEKAIKNAREIDKQYDELANSILNKNGSKTRTDVYNEIENRRAQEQEIVSLRSKTIAELEKKKEIAAKKEQQRIKEELEAAKKIRDLRTSAIENQYNKESETAKNVARDKIEGLTGTPQQIEEQTRLIKSALDRQLKSIEDKRLKATEQLKSDLKQRQTEINKLVLDSELKALERSLKTINADNKVKEIETNLSFSKSLSTLKKQLASKEITLIEFNKRKQELELKFKQDLLQIDKTDFAEKQRLNLEISKKKIEQIKANFEIEKAELLRQAAEKKKILQGQFEKGEITDTQLTEQSTSIDNQTNESIDSAEQTASGGEADIINDVALQNLALQQEIADSEVTINDDKNNRLLESDKRLMEQRKVMLDSGLNLLGTFVSGTKDLLARDEENKKKYGKVIKALALAEIAINLSKELSAIAVAAAANPANAFTFGASGITQYTVQSAIAIARSIFAATQVATQKFKFGGTLPYSGEFEAHQSSGDSFIPHQGLIQGNSHSQGGVKARFGSSLVELEGGEFRLVNGKEQYIINGKSTKQFLPELQDLSRMDSRKFNPYKRILASRINNFKGFGKKFNQGGVLSNTNVNTSVLDITPLSAPIAAQRPLNQSINLDSYLEESRALQLQQQKHIDTLEQKLLTIQVINDPLEAYDVAKDRLSVRNSTEF